MPSKRRNSQAMEPDNTPSIDMDAVAARDAMLAGERSTGNPAPTVALSP